MATVDASTADVLDTLVQRADFLECVLDGPRAIVELRDELDVSRSTVERTMNALETMGFVEACEQGYRTTSIGGVVTTDVLAFIDSVEAANGDEGGNGAIPAREVVTTVSSRRQLLESLRANPKDKRTLVMEVELSRSTVDRSVRELQTQGVIEYRDGKLAVTPVGEVALEGVAEMTATIEVGQRLKPVLQWVPPGTLDLDLQLLADAEIVLPEDGNPWAMVDRHGKMLKQVIKGQAILPLTGLHACEVLHDRVVNEGAVFECVVNRGVAETFETNPQYAGLVEEMIATGRFTVYEYDGELPYFVGVFGEMAQLGVDEDGAPRAVVETDSPEVAAWAAGKYDEYRQHSQKLS